VLTGEELFDWLALRRVHQGSVAMAGSCYLDNGRPVPCYLPVPLSRLIETGLLEAVEMNPCWARIVATASGRARYHELNPRAVVPMFSRWPSQGDSPE
jgi:hypothetical protein